jgi:hypothetical protein
MLRHLLSLALLPLAASAQDTHGEDPTFQPRSLVPEGPRHWGGFGSPVLKVSSVGGSPALLVGGRGATLVNHVLAFGGGGFSLVSSAPACDGCEQRPSLAYGGPTVNVLFFPEELLHLDVGALVGAGSADLPRPGVDDTRRTVFVIEPEANLELNVTDHVRVALGVSYRYVLARGGGLARDAALSGLSGNIALRFGAF